MLRLFYLQRIDHPILQCLSWGGRAKLFIFSWSLLDQKISHSHFHWIQILVCLPPPPPPGFRIGRICVEKKITIFSFCPTRVYPKIRMLKENKCFICFYFFSCKNEKCDENTKNCFSSRETKSPSCLSALCTVYCSNA